MTNKFNGLDYNTNTQANQIVRLFQKRTLLRRCASGLSLALFLLTLLLQPQLAQARSLASSTWVVAPHGKDFTSIGTAINYAAEGDTIQVMPGLYRERFILYKNVTIVGIGQREDIRIESKNPILANAPTARIKNLTIYNRSKSKNTEDTTAVQIANGQLIIEDCDISGGSGVAVTVSAHANPILTENRIYASLTGIIIEEYGSGSYVQNTIYANALWGVVAFKDSTPFFDRNIIASNLTGGVALLGGTKARLEGNKISLNLINGVMVQGSSPSMSHNKIQNNVGMGLFIIDDSRGTYINNVIKSNMAAGIVVQGNSHPNVDRNTITRNRYGISIGRRSAGVYIGNNLTGNNRGAFEIQDDAGRITASDNLPYNPSVP